MRIAYVFRPVVRGCPLQENRGITDKSVIGRRSGKGIFSYETGNAVRKFVRVCPCVVDIDRYGIVDCISRLGQLAGRYGKTGLLWLVDTVVITAALSASLRQR